MTAQQLIALTNEAAVVAHDAHGLDGCPPGVALDFIREVHYDAFEGTDADAEVLRASMELDDRQRRELTTGCYLRYAELVPTPGSVMHKALCAHNWSNGSGGRGLNRNRDGQSPSQLTRKSCDKFKRGKWRKMPQASRKLGSFPVLNSED